jgi:hypothetical protein
MDAAQTRRDGNEDAMCAKLQMSARALLVLTVGLNVWPTTGQESAWASIWQPELLNQLEEPWRHRALEITRAPQIQLRGVAESFPCQRDVYRWLLDHPDWAYRLWEELGVRGARVYRQPDGSFAGEDEQKNRLVWRKIFHQPGLHLWYVEATGQGNWLKQPMRVRALLLLQYEPVRSPAGKTGIRHATELLAQVDSRSWQWILRFGKNLAEDYARHCLEQVQMFFAGLAWYLSEHPHWGEQRIRQVIQERPEETATGQELLRLLSATAGQ